MQAILLWSPAHWYEAEEGSITCLPSFHCRPHPTPWWRRLCTQVHEWRFRQWRESSYTTDCFARSLIGSKCIRLSQSCIGLMRSKPNRTTAIAAAISPNRRIIVIPLMWRPGRKRWAQSLREAILSWERRAVTDSDFSQSPRYWTYWLRVKTLLTWFMVKPKSLIWEISISWKYASFRSTSVNQSPWLIELITCLCVSIWKHHFIKWRFSVLWSNIGLIPTSFFGMRKYGIKSSHFIVFGLGGLRFLPREPLSLGKLHCLNPGTY